MFEIHENETGSFQELAHKQDVDFGQLSILTIKEGCSRGGHYHRRKKEWFCCIQGECELDLLHFMTAEKWDFKLDRWFAPVQPYEIHTLTNTGEGECVILIGISERFDPRNPDTFPYPDK